MNRRTALYRISSVVKSPVIREFLRICFIKVPEQGTLKEDRCAEVLKMLDTYPFMVNVTDDEIARSGKIQRIIKTMANKIYNSGTTRANRVAQLVDKLASRVSSASSVSDVTPLKVPEGPRGRYVGYATNQLFPIIKKEALNATVRDDSEDKKNGK